MIHDTCHIEIAGNIAYHTFILQAIDQMTYRYGIMDCTQRTIYLGWVEITIRRGLATRQYHQHSSQ